MNSAIVTLISQDFHMGLGALVNSLAAHGFRGNIWCGYRGTIPPWARNVRADGERSVYETEGGPRIIFVPLKTQIHLTHLKPFLMEEVLDKYCPSADAVFYFDVDITVKCQWTFFERWAGRGVAVCEDNCYGNFPSGHPLRWEWKDFASRAGFNKFRELNSYYNAGFVGLLRGQAEVIKIWRALVEALMRSNAELDRLKSHDRSLPFAVPDQDALNLALMISESPVSAVGPEGMDFKPAGYIMSHAVDYPKAWNKSFLWSALKGRAPSIQEREYWKYASGPVPFASPLRRGLNKADLLLARIVSRLLGAR